MNDNKNILITGASSGIGAETSILLSHSGYRIIACSKNKNKLDDLGKKLQGKGHIQEAIDLEDEKLVKNLLTRLKKDNIKLSGLVCSAGAHLVKPIRITKKEDYQRIFLTNFITTSNILSNVLKILLPNASILILSSAGANRASAAISAYAASKNALEGLMRSAALEFASKGIRVNAILPGVVETEMTRKFLDSIGESATEQVIKRHPLGLGKPEDIASLIKFLISEKARWITGQSIVIDGGFSIQG